MAKSLVVVESPAKVRTIKRYIGADYDVKASMGHVRDLPVKELGVDVEEGFKPSYVTVKSKGKILKEIKDAAAKSDRIYLALDPDREGEAIAWHISQEIESGEKEQDIYRVQFNEITRQAVTQAFSNPGRIDQNKVDAQQARRILDRLVGYKLSPLLWSKIRRGLSAGRVQSVALRIICDREQEIIDFKSQEYWSITASLEAEEPPVFEARLNKVSGKKADVSNEEEAGAIVEEARGLPFTVSKLQRKERRRNPAPPFTTSTLQQEAFKQLRFAARKTMTIAQRLYEGLDVGEDGTVGLITYMRTDSIRVSDEAKSQARDYVVASYGREFVPKKPWEYKSKKSAQEAHEAVRPTAPSRNPETVKGFLGADEYALYRLIWNRFLASQMSAALYDTTTADIAAGKYEFRATGSIMKFRGFTILYEEAQEPDEKKKDEDLDKEERRLPPLHEGLALKLMSLDPKQHFTQPPPRYTEASLIKELEEKGIGRPSTYTSILNVIQNRDYVEVEERKFKPTPLGMLVTKMLVENFPTVLDVEFTARLENELDRIESGERPWRETLSEFYDSFLEYLQKAQNNMKGVKGEEAGVACDKCGSPMVVRLSKGGPFLACSAYPKCKNTAPMPGADAAQTSASVQETTDEVCDKCGSSMVIKDGRYGKFLACSAYPQCKNTRKIGAAETAPSGEPTDEKCDKCGSPLVAKDGRYGKFLACSAYPKCKNTRPMGTGIKCPEEGCDGTILPRRTKKGKTFYGCSRYPSCRFAAWDKPVDTPCPQCGQRYMLEKYTRNEGKHLKCPDKNCGHIEQVEVGAGERTE